MTERTRGITTYNSLADNPLPLLRPTELRISGEGAARLPEQRALSPAACAG